MLGHRSAFLVAAAAALAVLAGVNVLARPDHSRRNFEVFTEMAYSRAHESFSPSDVFADGKTLQPLVAGVVPRGMPPFPYGPGPEEASRAGAELLNPVAADAPGVAELGAELFRVHCMPCHDVRGTGKGAVVLRGMVPPPHLHADRALKMQDGEMFHILTLGQGNMPSYAAPLGPAERWAVIRHVRRLQQEGP